MKESTFLDLENLFLALSDKTRLRLLSLMSNGEVAVGFLSDALGESQPKTSRHLAYLRNAGLVSARRDGKRIYYNIQWPADAAVERILAVTIDSIASVKVEKERFSSAAEITSREFADESADIYAETYETEYKPDEMPIFLL